MKKNGFTLIELLAVIVVLAIVMVLATTTVLPLMNDSREKAFRTEAISVIESAETVRDLDAMNQVTLPSTSCSTSSKICLKVSDLISLGYYDGSENYTGTITIDKVANTYRLNLKKSNEFAIIGGTETDYVTNTTGGGALAKVADWKVADHETCSCS